MLEALRTDRGRSRVLLGAVVVVAVLAAVELTREAVVVHRLRRGVGDTWFHAADGRRWFRLDATRHDVPLAEISPFLQQAFVAVEDHRFYRHPGVDPIAVARATWRNLRAPGTVEGASTITQQLARTIFLSNKRSYLRKAREAVLSLVIEAELSKAQILELYLNRIYLSAGVYGVETMAQRVFGKPAGRLTLAESALIAGLARAPAALSPWSNLEGARRRSHVVLARMREAGFIDEAQQRDARRARLVVRPYASDGGRHGYAQAYLRQQFRDEFGGDHPPDWRVDTTIDLDLQDAAERAVGRGLDRLRRPALQAALVAMDPATGDVLAMVGGRDYARSAFNRATRSRRQPGSAFKPFVFAAALDHGMSPVTELTGLDALPAQGPDEWTPRNVHDDAPARLTLRTALFESNNRAAAALQQALGTRRVLRLASKAGLDDLPDVPSLALGTGLVSPLTLTAAYAAFPNGGLAVRPRGIVRVVDDDGALAAEHPVSAERMLSPQVAFQMVSMLGDVVDRGTGAAARRLGVRFPVGGKTGTTNDFKDAWFVGFSSSIVVGVWVGFDQPATIGGDAYGARAALPIWADFMQQAAKRRPPGAFRPPAGVRATPLCALSHRRPVDGCPRYTEYFKAGDDVPGDLCPLHEGTLRQRVTRAVDGLAAAIGRRIRDIFR